MKNRVDYIDWLKAVGIFLIVFGHYFGEPYNQFTQPIYPKQLGVDFFVFMMGWGWHEYLALIGKWYTIVYSLCIFGRLALRSF
jgi:peptidoglycan/LPS O-acetylase OafA/YrhL